MRKIILIGVVLVAIIGAGGWWFVNHKSKQIAEKALADAQNLVAEMGGELIYGDYYFNILNDESMIYDVVIRNANDTIITIKQVTATMHGDRRGNLDVKGMRITAAAMEALKDEFFASLSEEDAYGAYLIKQMLPSEFEGVDVDWQYDVHLGDSTMYQRFEAAVMGMGAVDIRFTIRDLDQELYQYWLAQLRDNPYTLFEDRLGAHNIALERLVFEYRDDALLDNLFALAFLGVNDRPAIAEEMANAINLHVQASFARNLAQAAKDFIQGDSYFSVIINAIDEPLTIEAMETAIGNNTLDEIMELTALGG